MKRYRQWLAEQQNHMTESPDGEYYLVIEVDAALAEKDDPLKISEELNKKGFTVVPLDQWRMVNEQIAALTAQLETHKRLREDERNGNLSGRY